MDTRIHSFCLEGLHIFHYSETYISQRKRESVFVSRVEGIKEANLGL